MARCSWGAPPRPPQADLASRAPYSRHVSGWLRKPPFPSSSRGDAPRLHVIYTKPTALDPSRNPFTRNNLTAIFQHLRLAPPGGNPLPTQKFLRAL